VTYATAQRRDLAEARLSKASVKAARDQRLVRMWNDSMTVKELAGMMKMSPKTVSRILVRAGVHVPQHVQRKGGG
jgi:DNA-binding CsgD family transcriptional regulator